MLNAELFERDPDHSAYAEAANNLVLATSRRDIPTVVHQIVLNHLQDVMNKTGIGRRFDAWAADLDESFCTAYLIATADEWVLDADKLNQLIDDGVTELNEARTAVGSDRVERDDLNTWLSILLLSFAHAGPEMEPLIDYIESQAAWTRVEFLRPTYEVVGAYVADVPEHEKDEWQAVNYFAWRDGEFLAVLEKAGIFAAAKAGRQTLASGTRALSAELYERDQHLYRLTAGQLISVTAHRVPEVMRELYWHLIGPFLADRKLAERYGQYLQDTFEAGYVLSVAETWDGLAPDHLREQMETGLRQVIAERDSRPIERMLPDPEYRIRNVSYGVVGDMPWFTEVTQTVKGHGAWERIVEMGFIAISATLEHGPIKGRHARKLTDQFRISFELGVVLGLLDQLGEVPASMPARM